MGWPVKSIPLEGRMKNELPIGIWIMTKDQYEHYLIWSSLRDAGLNASSLESFTPTELPDDFKGLAVVVGYKDVPF